MRGVARVALLGTALGLAALSAPAVAAPPAAVVSGGGTGVWGVTVPAMGIQAGAPASQFGLGVRMLGGGTADGHFNCLMAGRSQFDGFQYMAVKGQVTAGTATAGTATFSGSGSVFFNFLGGGDSTGKASVTFTVTVTEGGAGVGALQLTVFNVPLGPGGSLVTVAFPPEQVSSGQISVH